MARHRRTKDEGVDNVPIMTVLAEACKELEDVDNFKCAYIKNV